MNSFYVILAIKMLSTIEGILLHRMDGGSLSQVVISRIGGHGGSAGPKIGVHFMGVHISVIA